MDIKIINTTADETIRTVQINGVMHMQMKGCDHEIMTPSWGCGRIMTCPADVDIEAIADDPEKRIAYYNGYGDGCEMLETVLEVLWGDDAA